MAEQPPLMAGLEGGGTSEVLAWEGRFATDLAVAIRKLIAADAPPGYCPGADEALRWAAPLDGIRVSSSGGPGSGSTSRSLSAAGAEPDLDPRRGACEHCPWRAFLPAITGIGLDQPGRYAAFFFRPVHNIWV